MSGNDTHTPDNGATTQPNPQFVIEFKPDGTHSFSMRGKGVRPESLVNALTVAQAFFVQQQLLALVPQQRITPAPGPLRGLDGGLKRG